MLTPATARSNGMADLMTSRFSEGYSPGSPSGSLETRELACVISRYSGERSEPPRSSIGEISEDLLRSNCCAASSPRLSLRDTAPRLSLRGTRLSLRDTTSASLHV